MLHSSIADEETFYRTCGAMREQSQQALQTYKIEMSVRKVTNFTNDMTWKYLRCGYGLTSKLKFSLILQSFDTVSFSDFRFQIPNVLLAYIIITIHLATISFVSLFSGFYYVMKWFYFREFLCQVKSANELNRWKRGCAWMCMACYCQISNIFVWSTFASLLVFCGWSFGVSCFI